ncbi:tachylectin-related carbohydrate-binding protein [Streptomyces sp. NPDC097619]|uniref:tachylectin-related carbohydrate-binding protein n=1 Tax=Streptomyces sp. NPDC097619 TaxID=3157228 RepID=UPI0033216833
MTSALEADAAECPATVDFYVIENQPGKNLISDHQLRKFTDWSPKSGNTALVDTGHKVPLPLFGKFFGGARGVFYEVTSQGVLKSYKDNTGTGGALLAPVKSYGSGWGEYRRIFSSTTPAGRIIAQTPNGSIEVYQQSSPSTGGGSLTKGATAISASAPAALAIKAADDAWAFDGSVHTLDNGTVTKWDYSEDAPPVGGAGFAPRIDSPTVFASGLTDAKSAWMPGPGVLYTNSGSEDYSGIVKSYAGSPLSLKNADVMSGLYGESFPDAYNCLSEQTKEKPFGHFAEEPPPAPQEPSVEQQLPIPTGPTNVSGRFTLGDGKPAPA